MLTPADSAKPTADSLFAAWLARHEAGEEADFEAVHRENPDVGVELRDLHGHWAKVEAVRRQHGLGGSLSEKLKTQYGSGVDPQVTLEGEEQVRGDFSSEVLSRLAGRGPASTRYRVKGEVAHGGMGAVLRVWDEDLRRHLAMKVMLGKGVAKAQGDTPRVDQRMLARFLEEAQVTGQLDHPGIVPVHELGLDAEGRVFFTMKFVKGKTLKDVFDELAAGEGGWTQTRVLGLILKVCEAMSYAHAKGVIHRDLKPANIMVGKFGEVYVMDWGLAKILGREDERDIRIQEQPVLTSEVRSDRRDHAGETPDSPLYTMDGDVVGTPAYMSPEQAVGHVSGMGPPSDVYAVGAMLYHLLAGHMPYVPLGARLNNYAVWSHVQAGPPRPLHEIAPQAPAELVAICERAMAREVTDRYADMSALAADLSALVEGRVVSAYETGAWAEARKWVQRNKPLAASLAAAVALLVVGLGSSLVLKARADENARIAKANEALATQKAEDVLSLSAIQDLKELGDRADALWPADPEKVPEYEAWLADARVLIEGQPADPARGLKKRPSLAEHEAKLVEIRARAKPLTPEQVEADSRAGPGWEKRGAELLWLRRMLGEEPWPAEAEVEAGLAQEALPTDANALNTLAWPLVDVDPAKIVYGSEVRGLVLARRAVAAAQEAERAGVRDTLAWALYRTGRFDEARAEERRAVSEVEEAKQQEYEGYLAKLEESIAKWTGDGDRSEQSEAASKVAERVAELEREVSERRTYEFEDAQDRWWHAQLSKLVSDLKEFTDEKRGGLFSSGTSEEHGWGIVRRAEFARTVRGRSVEGPEAKRRWEEAVAAIRKSEEYGGLMLEPQVGLLPLGADPESGLWEFAHLATGEPPERGSDGKLMLTEETGVVLVLLPRGAYWMGAQSVDPNARNYDPGIGKAAAGRVEEVELSAFFFSKYELTQGQWIRLTGQNPSAWGPAGMWNSEWLASRSPPSLLHPVEQVSWLDCDKWLRRAGLSLPSEAQWEYGARAGTDTPWWTGAEKESLKGAANLLDKYAAEHGNASWGGHEPWLDDGATVHAPVGTYMANGFGLHDVHGNVWEWCLDGYVDAFYGRSARRDPVAPSEGTVGRSVRGGSSNRPAVAARVAWRPRYTTTSTNGYIGVRPARALAP